MRKSLLVLCLLLLGAAPAFAHKKHHHHHHHRRDRYSFHCDEFGCGFYRQRYRAYEHCVYKPWKDKTVCRYY